MILKYLADNFFLGKEYSINFITQPYSIDSALLRIRGYKHSLVQIIALSVAMNIKIKIKNPPLVSDTYIFIGIIQELGGKAFLEFNNLIIDPTNICSETIPYKLSKQIHGSMYLTAALIVKLGRFKYYGSGGCQIGDIKENGQRPINYIWEVMQKFNVEIKNSMTSVSGYAPESHLSSLEINIMDFSTDKNSLSGPLVGGATKTALILSTKCKKLTIFNPYLKTDVMDMLRLIKTLGKRVYYDNTVIIIEDSDISQPNFGIVEFSLTECVSEIITYATLAIINNIPVRFMNLNKDVINFTLKSEFELLKNIGVKFNWENNDLVIHNNNKIHYSHINVTPYGIQSDHHPFFSLILSRGNSPSSITEFVWKDRFKYVSNLQKLGFKIFSNNQTVNIIPSQPNPTKNIVLNGYDVRTTAITLLASIYTKSEVIIKNSEHILRGYSDLLGNLKKFGITIKYKKETQL